MRPYLEADGGNVRLAEIDGPVVKLELEGACGSCPSSSVTMKMGLERRLLEAIPEISEVVQTMPGMPDFNEESLEQVLEGVRPFLKIAGGNISVVEMQEHDIQPYVLLKMEGQAGTVASVRGEIISRIQREFGKGVRVEYA